MASDYTDVASVIAKHGDANPRIHTVHVMTDRLENPTKTEFEEIVQAVYDMPSVRRFGIFCWSIPVGAAGCLVRLMTDRPLIVRISLLGNIMSKTDYTDLENALLQKGVAGRITLEGGYVIRDAA